MVPTRRAFIDNAIIQFLTSNTRLKLLRLDDFISITRTLRKFISVNIKRLFVYAN